MLPQPTNDLLK